MYFIWMILIGFVVGFVAKLLVPGPQKGGFILTTVLGIAGSFFGSWLFGMIGIRGGGSFIGAVVGAVLLLLIGRAINK